MFAELGLMRSLFRRGCAPRLTAARAPSTPASNAGLRRRVDDPVRAAQRFEIARAPDVAMFDDDSRGLQPPARRFAARPAEVVDAGDPRALKAVNQVQRQLASDETADSQLMFMRRDALMPVVDNFRESSRKVLVMVQGRIVRPYLAQVAGSRDGIPAPCLVDFTWICGRPVSDCTSSNASRIEHELAFPPPMLYTSAIRGLAQKASMKVATSHAWMLSCETCLPFVAEDLTPGLRYCTSPDSSRSRSSTPECCGQSNSHRAGTPAYRNTVRTLHQHVGRDFFEARNSECIGTDRSSTFQESFGKRRCVIVPAGRQLLHRNRVRSIAGHLVRRHEHERTLARQFRAASQVEGPTVRLEMSNGIAAARS